MSPRNLIICTLTFLALANLITTQVNQGSFKKNVQSYISQVELPPYGTRSLLFDLEESFQNCNVVVEFFPRYHFAAKDAELNLRCAFDVISPNGNKLVADTFKLGKEKQQKPIKKKMKFEEKGTYTIEMKNIEDMPIIGAIMLDMEDCKAHDTHVVSSQMDKVTHRVQKMVWRLFEMFGMNEITESSMEHKATDLKKSHHRLTYTAISEVAAMFLIAGWQVWYIKNILENKNVV